MISIIFPVFNEEGNLNELYQRCTDVIKGIHDDFELIFVDDRSTDSSLNILIKLHEKDNRVKIIKFARNCGSHAALTAGLHYCTGDCAIVLASDLQDPPQLIEPLLAKWKQGDQIVWGVRSKREGEGFLTNLCSKIYYHLMNRLTNVKIPPKGTDVFLADRHVIEAFKSVPEKHTSVFMTLAWLGFKQAEHEYIKEARLSGRSKWSVSDKIKLTLDSLLAFSDVPIRMVSVLGIMTAILGFLYALFIFIRSFSGSPVEGWSSLMVVILIIGGVQMTMAGLLGEYLWRTYDESRRRPRYIIESIMDANNKG